MAPLLAFLPNELLDREFWSGCTNAQQTKSFSLSLGLGKELQMQSLEAVRELKALMNSEMIQLWYVKILAESG